MTDADAAAGNPAFKHAATLPTEKTQAVVCDLSHLAHHASISSNHGYDSIDLSHMRTSRPDIGKPAAKQDEVQKVPSPAIRKSALRKGTKKETKAAIEKDEEKMVKTASDAGRECRERRRELEKVEDEDDIAVMPRRERNVTFSARQSSIVEYVEPDGEKAKDDNSSGDDAKAPPEIAGFLMKQSPSAVSFYRYQKRYVVLKNAKMRWWVDKSDFSKGKKYARGCLDFKVNAAVMKCTMNKDSSTQFVLEPEGGKWIGGSFTGAESGRAFNFDTLVPQEPHMYASAWRDKIQEHMDYALSLKNSED